MKKQTMSLDAIELAVIAIVSLVAAYALLGVGALFLIPFGVLFLLGVLTIVVLPLGTFIFAGASVLMLLPALMKLNNVKWWVFSPERLAFCPDLSLPAGLAVGLLVISGSLFLGYLQPLRRDLMSLQKAGANAKDCRQYMVSQCITAGAAVFSGAILALALVLALSVARGGLAGWIGKLSWAPSRGRTRFLGRVGPQPLLVHRLTHDDLHTERRTRSEDAPSAGPLVAALRHPPSRSYIWATSTLSRRVGEAPSSTPKRNPPQGARWLTTEGLKAHQHHPT